MNILSKLFSRFREYEDPPEEAPFEKWPEPGTPVDALIIKHSTGGSSSGEWFVLELTSEGNATLCRNVYTSDPKPHSPALLARHGAFTRTGLRAEFEKLVQLTDGQPIYDCSRSVGNAIIGISETIVQVVTSQGSKTVISRDPENDMKRATHKPEPEWLRGIRQELMSLSEDSDWVRIEEKKPPGRLFKLEMQMNARAKREPEIVGYWPFDHNF